MFCLPTQLTVTQTNSLTHTHADKMHSHSQIHSFPSLTRSLSHPLFLCLIYSTPIYPTANNSYSPSNGQITPYHHKQEQQQQNEHGYYKTTIPVGVGAGAGAGTGSTANSSNSTRCAHCQTADLYTRALTQERNGGGSGSSNNNNKLSVAQPKHIHAYTKHTHESTSSCDGDCAAAATAKWRSSRVCKNHTTTTTTTLEYELSNFAKLTTQISTQRDVDEAGASVEEAEILAPPILSSSHWQQLQQSLHELHQNQAQSLLGNPSNNNSHQIRKYSSDNMSKDLQRDRLGLWGTDDNEIVGSVSGLDRMNLKRYNKVSLKKAASCPYAGIVEKYQQRAPTDYCGVVF